MSAAETTGLLTHAYAGRLATIGANGYPYIVPLLFVWLDGEVWVHNTRVRGHLRDNVDRVQKVCFEVDEPGPVFPYGSTECDTSIAYRSVVAYGTIRIVDDREQKQRFFAALLDKYRDPKWDRERYSFPRIDHVTVYAIAIREMTGKQTPLPAPEAQWPASDRRAPA
jgi:nitroimidazol reductase NimA-like FMN-containing flavoprotein (pyridoxamine 5'-phosphate oxidase superfamily)